MTSKQDATEAYVWIWLPGTGDPVVAGKLEQYEKSLKFNYGRSYLALENAIPIFDAELPLKAGDIPLLDGLTMPGCIRDAAPDAWGRRVIMNKVLGASSRDEDPAVLGELLYLLESGSDRIGALDFQASPSEYVPRQTENAQLEELLKSAERVVKGIPLNPELDKALHHGSSIGGARPKALIQDGDKKYIAKFPLDTDLYNVVKAEYIAMRLAETVGLNVAPVMLKQASKKDVLLVERFDRSKAGKGWERKIVISALTLLGLDEMMARYASYQDLAEIIRGRFARASATSQELFSRMVFNILCGNTDDHARNHAAFWDGEHLELTPAYDICPQSRAGNEASQAMEINGRDRMSRLTTCLAAAPHFLVSEEKACSIINTQIQIIRENWDEICDEAELNEIDRALLWNRQFLNAYALAGWQD